MTTMWDELPAEANNFVSFTTVGDTVSGVITQLGIKKWDDGSVSPQLNLTCDDGEDRTLTAGQIRLKSALRDARPEVGDHIKVTLTAIDKRAMGKTLKVFDVVVTPAAAKDAKPTPKAKAAATSTDDPIAAHPQGAKLRAAGIPDEQILTALGLGT